MTHLTDEQEQMMKKVLLDATIMIEALREQLAEAQASVKVLRDFAIKISQQIPEKPDHWASCSQCEHNSSDAEDVIEATEPK